MVEFDIALVEVSLVLCGFGVGWWVIDAGGWVSWVRRGGGSCETSDISCVAGGCLLGGG